MEKPAPRSRCHGKGPAPRLTVGWYFSQFSHQACVFCSKQMLRFKIWANS